MKVKESIPLLHDHHSHPYLYATLFRDLNLSSIIDKEQALAMISEINEEITVVTGWNNRYYSFTDQELQILPAVVIVNISLHSFVISNAALKKIPKRFEDIILNRNNPQWIEQNFYHIINFISSLKPPDQQCLSEFISYLLKQHGIWIAEELSIRDQKEIMYFNNEGIADRTRFWMNYKSYADFPREYRSSIYGLKIFTDGALGPFTAKLKYSYPQGGNGFLNYTDNELQSILWGLIPFSKPLAIHAIGDLAIDQVIRVVESISKEALAFPEVRIEHAQLISQENAEKAKKLGLVLSMQPNFNNDSEIYQDRLPKGYVELNNPFRMLIDTCGFIPGKDLLFGSDGMPHGVNYALQSALYPSYNNQQLTLDEFIAGYCIDNTVPGTIDITLDNEKRSVETIINIH